jgi:hypothetical protein
MQFQAEYSEAPIRTIADYILDGCAVFGINTYSHIKNTLISKFKKSLKNHLEIPSF